VTNHSSCFIMTISKDTSAPLIVVVGATGAQGGSVIKALAESDRPYRIRGFTRDTSKPAAQALAEQGVETVAIDVNPTPENIEKIHKAFEGATYAFAVTIAAVVTSKDREIAEGKTFVDAAKAANVRLLVWSGLESCSELSGGKYVNVDHFDAKGEITKYARASGVPFVNVEAGGYMQNFFTFFPPKKQPDGSFAMLWVVPPESEVFLIDADEDYGLFVRKAIESPGESEIFAYGEIMTVASIAKTLTEGTGKTVNYVQISEDEYKKGLAGSGMPDHSVQSILEVFLCGHEFGYYGKKDVGPSLQGLARKPRTFAEFIKVTDFSKVLA